MEDDKIEIQKIEVFTFIVLFVSMVLVAVLLLFIFSITDNEKPNIIQKDSIEYKIKQIDSINYNIIQRDSIIYKHTTKYIEDVEKSKTLDDSSSVKLFYSLVEDKPF